MTTIGHTLTGLAFAVLCVPERWRSRRGRAFALAAFAVLANAPDLSIPGWGHDLYHVSHSLFVNAGLIAVAVLALAASRRARALVGGWPVIACGAAAWLSHLVLDSFYNHGLGIAIYWPLSEGRLNLSMPWFSTLRPSWALDAHCLRVALTEIVAYGSLLLACLGARRFVVGLRSRGGR